MKNIPKIVKMKANKGFYKWAWDTVVGCKNGCEYCYAKHITEAVHHRDFSKVLYFNDLWDEPAKVKPSLIFVDHFSDIMGDWVPAEWIQKVISVAESLPKHEFLFMTKNPVRYTDFKFPNNCILGVTIESPKEWVRAKIIEYLPNRKMASVEPILGDFTGYDFSQFEFVVVGALWTFDDKPLDKRFYDTVKHSKIYYTR